MDPKIQKYFESQDYRNVIYCSIDNFEKRYYYTSWSQFMFALNHCINYGLILPDEYPEIIKFLKYCYRENKDTKAYGPYAIILADQGKLVKAFQAIAAYAKLENNYSKAIITKTIAQSIWDRICRYNLVREAISKVPVESLTHLKTVHGIGNMNISLIAYKELIIESKALKQKREELLYAPGGPEYRKAAESFMTYKIEAEGNIK